MTDIPRDPSFYHRSIHSGQNSRHRNIDSLMIEETIREGEVRETHRKNVHLFVKEFWYTELPVGVVANTSAMLS